MIKLVKGRVVEVVRSAGSSQSESGGIGSG